MAIDRIPGVGPQNTDIATAVAAAVPTISAITSSITTNAASAGLTNASITSAGNAAGWGATGPTTTQIAAAVPTLAQINTSVANNAPSPNNWTVITSTNTNNTANTYTFSSLSGYRSYKIIYSGNHQTSASQLCLRFNGDTSAIYNTGYFGYIGGATGSADFSNDKMPLGPTMAQTGTYNSIEAIIDNVTLGCYKPVKAWIIGTSAGSNVSINFNGMWRSTATITSITFFTGSSVNLTNGNITLLGVN